MSILDSYMEQKGAEYRAFDASRAKRLFGALEGALRESGFCNPKKTIQILGTNGKGSSGRFLAHALAQNGASYLHFTSPHIFSFNERFYKNGAIVGDGELKRAHDILQSFDFMREASYFEYATFLAFVLANDVDFLILEAGVGGEMDSTSALKRDICAFSMIDFDHEEMLGRTIEAIAKTKLNAMVARNIIGMQIHESVLKIAREIAQKKGAELFFVDGICPRAREYVKRHKMPDFLAQNFSLSLKILEILNLPCGVDSLPKLDLRGRFEEVAQNIIIDVGHTESAARAVKNSLKRKKVILVYNSYFQKNIKQILNILKNNIARVEILDMKGNERIVNRDVLEQILRELEIEFCDFSGISRDAEYLVFGSFSVIESFLKSVDL